jgi:hypothetical protein
MSSIKLGLLKENDKSTVWWQKKWYCSDMPNVVSAIEGTSHEIQIPSNESQQKNILSANQFVSLIDISVTTFEAEIGVPRKIHRPVASH